MLTDKLHYNSAKTLRKFAHRKSFDYNFHYYFHHLRARLHGGGGPQIGEVTCGESPHLSGKSN